MVIESDAGEDQAQRLGTHDEFVMREVLFGEFSAGSKWGHKKWRRRQMGTNYHFSSDMISKN